MIWVFHSRAAGEAHRTRCSGTVTLQSADNTALVCNSLQVGKLHVIIVIFSQLFAGQIKRTGLILDTLLINNQQLNTTANGSGKKPSQFRKSSVTVFELTSLTKVSTLRHFYSLSTLLLCSIPLGSSHWKYLSSKTEAPLGLNILF